jgi:hypothetical protein
MSAISGPAVDLREEVLHVNGRGFAAYPPRKLIERKAEIPVYSICMVLLVLLNLHTHTKAVQAKLKASAHSTLDPHCLRNVLGTISAHMDVPANASSWFAA